jgi:membrane-associated phospholipid phosphatase
VSFPLLIVVGSSVAGIAPIAGFVLLYFLLWALFYAILPGIRRGARLAVATFTGLSSRYTRLNGWAMSAGKRITPFRAYLPVGLVVLVGVLLTAWLGDAFADLAQMVHTKSTALGNLDSRVHAWSITERNAASTAFFTAATLLGSPVGMGGIAIIIAIALAIRHRYRWAIYLVATAGTGALLNLELKNHFARARPDVVEMLRRANGYSFPSGHAMGTTVVVGALTYLAMRSSREWRTKAAAMALGCCVILAVSLSRVYLGVHWFSDVVAGMAAGATCVIVMTMAYETLRRVQIIQGPASPTQHGEQRGDVILRSDSDEGS